MDEVCAVLITDSTAESLLFNVQLLAFFFLTPLIWVQLQYLLISVTGFAMPRPLCFSTFVIRDMDEMKLRWAKKLP
jgi:hypothetical protein